MRDFYSIINSLKFVRRKGWADRGLDADSIAAHAYGAMVLGWLIADKEGVDKSKVLEMLLVHDLVMAKIEDVTPSSGKYAQKRDLEKGAKELVAQALPEGLRDRYVALFDEFRAQESLEAKVACEADKLETLMQGEIYEEKMDKNDVLNEFLTTYASVFQTGTGKNIFEEIKARHEKRKK